MKEPWALTFFKGAVYEFIYNEDSKFSLPHVGLLNDLLDQSSIDLFRNTPTLVAQPSMKYVKYDPEKPTDQCKEEYYSSWLVGTILDRT